MTPEQLEQLHARSIRVPRPWSAAEFAHLLSLPDIHLTGDAQGFALGRTVGDESELLTLVTAPEARRGGKARARMAAYEAEARARGADAAFLEVAETNVAACALYASCGYREVGRRPRYYRDEAGVEISAVVMRKPLERQ